MEKRTWERPAVKLWSGWEEGKEGGREGGRGEEK